MLGSFGPKPRLSEELFVGLDVPAADKADILGLNAARLFGINPVVSTAA